MTKTDFLVRILRWDKRTEFKAVDIGTAHSNIFFPFLVTNVAASSMGSGGVFILIAIVAAIIAVAVIFLGVETRGESVENIGDVE